EDMAKVPKFLDQGGRNENHDIHLDIHQRILKGREWRLSNWNNWRRQPDSNRRITVLQTGLTPFLKIRQIGSLPKLLNFSDFPLTGNNLKPSPYPGVLDHNWTIL